ncbi:MAG TPA: hypothetical protein VNT32_09060, partial [Thermoleophilaceae bacterium]|nr:hypothetical protein [Thermoleophilaceae bacterium]
ESDEQEAAPEVDFDFAAGWPDEIRGLVGHLFAFDLDDVQGRDRLGSLYFAEAPATVSSIRALVKDLAQEPWDELPGSITEGHLSGQLQSLNSILDQMLDLSADASNAPTEKTSLDQQLDELHEWFRSEVRPHAVTARVNRRVEEVLPSGDGEEATDAQLSQRLAQMSELNAKVEQLRRELEAREDLVSGLREAAGESAGEELAGVFAERAQTLGGTAKSWFKALVGSVATALLGGTATFLILRPASQGQDADNFAALGLGIFIVGLLVFAIRVCAQNYRVNRHLEAVANSKAAALSTFKRLVASIEEQEIRSAVALALAQAVFATEETGLVESAGDHVTLVERALAPRISGASAPPPA